MSMNQILKTIQTSGSLHTVSIRARVGPHEPETLLNADWETFCDEIIRVRSKDSFTITLWIMGYAYGHPPLDVEISVFKDHLNRRCESTLSRLHFSSLVNSPRCTIVLSHTLE